jgi:hypothetical protein
MGSVVFQCEGCGLDISPDAEVSELTRQSVEFVGGQEQSRKDRAYAHLGHEMVYQQVGFHVTAHGILSELRSTLPSATIGFADGEGYQDNKPE